MAAAQSAKSYKNIFKKYPKNYITRDIELVVKAKDDQVVLDGGTQFGFPEGMPREYSVENDSDHPHHNYRDGRVEVKNEIDIWDSRSVSARSSQLNNMGGIIRPYFNDFEKDP